jgi:hypothetical protein
MNAIVAEMVVNVDPRTVSQLPEPDCKRTSMLTTTRMLTMAIAKNRTSAALGLVVLTRPR